MENIEEQKTETRKNKIEMISLELAALPEIVAAVKAENESENPDINKIRAMESVKKILISNYREKIDNLIPKVKNDPSDGSGFDVYFSIPNPYMTIAKNIVELLDQELKQG